METPLKPHELQKFLADEWIERNGTCLRDDSNKVRKIRELITHMKEAMPLQILDIGCADGSVLKPFTASNHITGVDICAEFLKEAKQRGYASTIHQNIDSEKLALPDKAFDLVIAADVLEHVVDTDWLLCEINRVMRPNGVFILCYPNVRTLVSLGVMLLKNIPPVGSARYRAGHFRDFTTATMDIALRNSGFWLVRNIGADIMFPVFGDCLPWLASKLPSWSTQVIALCAKRKDKTYTIADAVNRYIYD